MGRLEALLGAKMLIRCQDLTSNQLHDLKRYMTNWFGVGNVTITDDKVVVVHPSKAVYQRHQRNGMIHETFRFYTDNLEVDVTHTLAKKGK